MKINNGTILEFINVLTKFQNQKGIVGFAIAKNLKIFRAETEEVTLFRNDLIKKYGDKDENGALFITEKSENYSKFVEEYIPVLNCEVDINLFKIPRKDFDFEFEKDATVKDYEALEFILCE